MPYIKPDRRTPIDENIENLISHCTTKGELNYAVSRLIHRWISHKGKDYQNLSDAKAALNDAAAEFQRTIMDPYENIKGLENGPVSDLDSEFFSYLVKP